jgi:hypothetical protein
MVLQANSPEESLFSLLCFSLALSLQTLLRGGKTFERLRQQCFSLLRVVSSLLRTKERVRRKEGDKNKLTIYKNRGTY